MENELAGKVICAKLLKVDTWLLEDEYVHVIVMYGMPAMGKTFLLKEINNNEKVVSLFQLVIWLTVSSDFDISSLQRQFFERIELPGGSNFMSIDEATMMLHSVFKERRLLLILDDVWRRIDVSNLGISLSENYSKICIDFQG
ncbi:hypothetical protein SUGI_0134060 [Cryptomeria japonica]|nr:hypothetical protein SUGI_0134060 [Cryptomeria japonica]